MRVAAVKSNDTVSVAIEFLDFSDDTVFVNTASQLVASLTSDYPFTAMLVEADSSEGKTIAPIRQLEVDR